MLTIKVKCDGCGKEEEGSDWPSGWYYWQQQDLCHDCAVPEIIKSLNQCEDDDWVSPLEAPIPIHASRDRRYLERLGEQSGD